MPRCRDKNEPPRCSLMRKGLYVRLLTVSIRSDLSPVMALSLLSGYVNPNEDFVLVVVATVSVLSWPWIFRRELPTTTAKGTAVPAR